jgi:hypothetical protein
MTGYEENSEDFEILPSPAHDVDDGLVVFEFALETPPYQLDPNKNTESPKPYKFFGPRKRSEIFQFCQTTAEYIDENAISAVAFLDRSARPMWIGLNEYWKKFYGDKPAPATFFVNPKGFRNGEVNRERIEAEHPYLAEHKDEAVLLIDACIHSGRSMKSVKQGLEKGGFTDVRVGVANDSGDTSDVHLDLVMQKELPEGLCYPFGTRFIRGEVRKGDQLHSKARRGHKRQSRRTAQVRHEIKRIINEYGDGNVPIEYPESSRAIQYAAMGGALGALVGEALNVELHPDLVPSLATIALLGIDGAILGRTISRLKK